MSKAILLLLVWSSLTVSSYWRDSAVVERMEVTHLRTWLTVPHGRFWVDMIPVWQARRANLYLSGTLMPTVRNGKTDLAAIQHGIGLWSAAWGGATLAVIGWRFGLLGMLLTFCSTCFARHPGAGVMPWDGPALFFAALSVAGWAGGRWWLVAASVLVGLPFKETSLSGLVLLASMPMPRRWWTMGLISSAAVAVLSICGPHSSGYGWSVVADNLDYLSDWQGWLGWDGLAWVNGGLLLAMAFCRSWTLAAYVVVIVAPLLILGALGEWRIYWDLIPAGVCVVFSVFGPKNVFKQSATRKTR